MILPQYYLKIDSMEEMGVRDDIEPEVAGQRMEENLLDANDEVYDTILMGGAIEATRGRLKTLRTGV